MNISQDKSKQLEDRMMEFAINVIKLTKSVSKSVENEIICKQLIRSATSVGANYAEANNAASKQDFKNKIFIAKKEAAESRYWLKLLAKTNADVNANKLIDESTQLLLILQKIISTMKNGK